MNELVDIQKRFIVRYAVLLTESDVQEIIRIAKANNIQIRLSSNRERQIYLEDANTNVLTKIIRDY